MSDNDPFSVAIHVFEFFYYLIMTAWENGDWQVLDRT